MSKEIYISSTPHETRLAIVEKDELTEIYYERENEYTLAGSIYNGRVTRVLPGMQSSFVDIGLERDAFLYITDFMEEQGDAADFEAAETGGGRRDRGRPRRDEEGAEAASGSREPAARADAEAQPDRDRRRGRRGDAGRTPGREMGADAASLAPDRMDVPAGPGEAEGDTEEIGEGAPGADGSRRWRGRRGRRRGRGSNGEGREAGATSGAAGENGAADTPELRNDEPLDMEFNAAAELPAEHGGFEGGREHRGRDRHAADGGRGDRGRREGRGGNRQEPARERSTPRAGRYGENGGDLDMGAPAEPIILPGESLSKYRPGGDAEGAATQGASAANQMLVAPKPSTAAFRIEGWDGGLTLPGETLSRHREPRGSAPQAEAPRPGSGRVSSGREESVDRGDPGGRDRRRERDERRGRPGQQTYASTALTPAEAVMPGVTSQHEPEFLPLSDDAPAFELGETEERIEVEQELAADVMYEPVTDLAPASTKPSQTLLEAVEEFHEVVAEYEPGDEASASFRVDPAGPSEFRQNAPSEELYDEEFAAVRFEEHGTLSADAAEHEFTSVQPTGEMISEEPLTPETEAAPLDAVQPAAPIEHEASVLSVTAAQAETTTMPVEVEAAGQGEFAPGVGDLEEELIDDDYPEVFDLKAGAFDDEMEEETLEGAADIGTMLREMSIDHITAPEPVELDDEDEYSDGELEEDELASDDEFGGGDVSEAEEDEALGDDELEDEAAEPGSVAAQPAMAPGEREPERDGERRGRRENRRGGRDRGDRGSRDRRSSGGGGIPSGRNGGRPGRHSAQTTDLPAISDLLKPGQELLVQIAKEPIAKKGARITSHIALPGRFLVFMPTVNHVGVSRKIESDGERRRLKEILLSEKGEASGGFIVRTAASGASEEELRSDLRFLLHLWADIKQRSESSKSPALIYHDLNLVERILRDQVTDNFSAIWVDTETEYERVLRFLQRFQPSLIRRVKLYSKDTPLFEQFGISEEINKALRSKVWLKSGGSIVINQTEALVAIDINTGKYVGKTARLEDTIVKTNLDAIPEIVRQIRLRDLGGIIIIDFIDMDERKNRNKVMAALEEELKKDRAPSKVLQFNDFGLVAITRKRVKQSLERTLSTTCGVCAGTGMVKAPVTVCNEIFIELRKMHKVLDKGDIMLRVNPEVVKQLKSAGGKWLQEMEELSGKTILVKSDPSLHPEQFDIH